MSSLIAPAGAQTPVIAEGRPAAPIPDSGGDHYYERRRIKRSVPVDPFSVTTRWDRLHGAVPGTPILATYSDWDDEFVYFAVETVDTTEVRLDIDGAGDGWLRGADNLSVRVAPGNDGPSFCTVTAQRWDTVQNKERPVWAASPIPADAIKAVQGRAGAGAITVVAIPASQLIGLKRKAGAEFGVRFEVGSGAATTDRAEVSFKPLLRLALADDVAAAGGGLSVRFFVRDRELVPGQPVGGFLELHNESKAPITVRRFFWSGSLGAEAAVDSATQNEVEVKPGGKVRRDFRSNIGPSIGTAAFVLKGGVELSDGQQVVALTSASRVEPFAVELDLDDKPVPQAAPEAERKRLAVVSVRSRIDAKTNAKVTVKLPAGWSVEGGENSRTLKLAFATEVKTSAFKVIVPTGTAPGMYPVGATVEVNGKTYETSAMLRVTTSG